MACTSCSKPAGETPVASGSSVITSTTKIAGAGVLGNDRRPDESCAPEPAAVDPGGPTRPVGSGTSRGDIEVPADPQRIVVLSGDQLDALCALGLQSRIVAAALPDGSESQPSYLGTVIHNLAPVGTRSTPDTAGIAAAHPDLILGSQALAPQDYGQFLAIAPTVFTGAPGAHWQDTLRAVGAATGRAAAADGLIADFDDQAKQSGVADDAAHFQASVVQLTADTVRVYGADNFPASVLTAVGADRPASQRFTDKPFVELSDTADLSAADGDIIYLSFDSPAAKEHAATLMDSDAWRALSATKDNRVFVVNNEIWQTGQGLVAARGVMADLRWLNAPIN
ncbi:iron-siderophore ABC transporter substrate-binding protein [Mycolicibacterium komossense]|uniref:Iron-siderophore ABC transporter substrate-binding protein n=2 Tax=Mycolicibacterium komossense TaxID=1779 RepID=A0ABT3CGA8_9MYCO|nr:iron-siderophore ABC transporter substrate-binding protein [Mycolicibacterium komossense]